MEVITFSAIKGGVGKTTIAFNYGEWLANQGKKVLMLDLDHQCNLSMIYDVDVTENTIANAFQPKEQKEVVIHHVKENIDMIAGYLRLDEVETKLQNQDNKTMLLYMWLSDNYQEKNLGQYDYLIIDCHPDFSIATKNAVAISDTVFSPLAPSKDDYNAKFNLSTRLEMFRNTMINFDTRESYITTNLYFFGNKVMHNTNSSKEFQEKIRTEEDVISYMPNKELINSARKKNQSIEDVKQDKNTYNQHQAFFEIAENFFQTLKKYS